MLQNKIYQNFLIEIAKNFIVILFGLSIIALTVRAINFLELIVDSGYPIITYFKYSFLNLFGIAPKFIPLAFLLSLMIFILKHVQNSEFVILWTSGVKKIKIVNLFFILSVLISVFYLFFSIFFTPFALNKSRLLLGNDQLNSFLPIVKTQQFTDSFEGFTFIVEKKIGNEIKNIFMYDKNNNLKSLSSNSQNTSSTTVIAREGLIDKKRMFLFNGQIISSKRDNKKNEIIKFEQLSIDLSELNSATVKKPKLQETSTLKLLNCFLKNRFQNKICEDKLKKEIIPILNRRLILPFYIPVIALVCSLMLIKSKKFYYSKYLIFSYNFIILLFTELAVRYTGINSSARVTFIILPIILILFFYSYLIFKFSKKREIYE